MVGEMSDSSLEDSVVYALTTQVTSFSKRNRSKLGVYEGNDVFMWLPRQLQEESLLPILPLFSTISLS